MGKLAERLADAQRSGLYRIVTTEALEEAAALNGFVLRRVVFNDSPDLSEIERAGDGRVLLLTGFEARLRAAPGSLDELLRRLEDAAAASRARGERCFVVFLDPGSLVAVPPLYNWRRGG